MPDLALCDMMMEKIDAGSKVSEELRSRNLNVPIYLLSSIANVTASNIQIGSWASTACFRNPFDPDQLVSLIHKSLPCQR
jgi:CheY-like chemotaxis protein